MQAYAEGKKIQVKCKTDSNALTEKWADVANLDLDISRCYRIKPEPTCRPFKNADECWQEMLKHRPVGYIIEDGNMSVVLCVKKDTIETTENIYKYGESFNELSFADGTTFGIKEEEYYDRRKENTGSSF